MSAGKRPTRGLRRPDAPPSLWRLAFWLIVALQAVVLIVFLRDGGPAAKWSQIAFLVLTVFLLVAGRRQPGWVLFLPALAALLNTAGRLWGLFEGIRPYDEIMHFYTAFAVCLPLGLIAHGRGLPGFRRPLRLAVSTFVLGMSLGIFWELAEGTLNPLHGMNWDTTSDLLLDGLGAALAGMAAVRLVTNRQNRSQI